MTAKCEAKNEATVSGGSPRIRRSRPGTNMRVLFAVVDKNRTPAEKRARIFYVSFSIGSRNSEFVKVRGPGASDSNADRDNRAIEPRYRPPGQRGILGGGLRGGGCLRSAQLRPASGKGEE